MWIRRLRGCCCGVLTQTATSALQTRAVSSASPSAPLHCSDSTSAGIVSPATSSGGDDAVDGDIVTPWQVVSKGPKGIDYNRVVSQFRSEPIDEALLQRFQNVVVQRHEKLHRPGSPPPLHPFLKRGIAFSHRDLNLILDEIESGKSVYLYTGRGPSATTMHLGHAVPFLLTKYLQDVLGCPLVIQLTDDEKFLFRDIPLGAAMDKMATNNIKDIIAFGFDVNKTFIFRNTQYMGELYPTVLEVQRLLTTNAVKNTFGFNDSDNIGKMSFAAIQAAPSFCSSFRKVLPIKGNNLKCLIPCAIDQDPFFVLTRGVSERMKRPKPALIHTKFLPALKGATHKMSSSAEHQGVILLTDNDAQVLQKLNKAFSGGSGTLEELREKGADLDADVAYQFLRIFSHDEGLVDQVTLEYRSGVTHSGHVKKIAAGAICQDILGPWRYQRSLVTDDQVETFMAVRNILF